MLNARVCIADLKSEIADPSEGGIANLKSQIDDPSDDRGIED
jgi:hypothetical protein